VTFKAIPLGVTLLPLQRHSKPLSLYLDAFIKYNPFTPAIAEFSIRSGKEGSFIGLGYRSNKDVNIILQMGDQRRINFGYIYTYSISELQQYSNGSN
jgi:hypothetical protein